MELLVFAAVLFLWLSRDYLENRLNFVLSEEYES